MGYLKQLVGLGALLFALRSSTGYTPQLVESTNRCQETLSTLQENLVGIPTGVSGYEIIPAQTLLDDCPSFNEHIKPGEKVLVGDLYNTGENRFVFTFTRPSTNAPPGIRAKDSYINVLSYDRESNEAKLDYIIQIEYEVVYDMFMVGAEIDGRNRLAVRTVNTFIGGRNPPEGLHIYEINPNSYTEFFSTIAYGAEPKIIQQDGKLSIIVPEVYVDPHVPFPCPGCSNPVRLHLSEWDGKIFTYELNSQKIPREIRREYALVVAESLNLVQRADQRREIIEKARTAFGPHVMEEAMKIVENRGEITLALASTQNNTNVMPEEIVRLTKDILQTEDDELAYMALDHAFEYALFIDPETGVMNPYAFLKAVYLSEREHRGLDVVEPGVGSEFITDLLLIESGMIFLPEPAKDLLRTIVANQGHDLAEIGFEPVDDEENGTFRSFRIKDPEMGEATDEVITLPSSETFVTLARAYTAWEERDYLTLAQIAVTNLDNVDFDKLEQTTRNYDTSIRQALSSQQLQPLRDFYNRNQSRIREDVRTASQQLETFRKNLNQFVTVSPSTKRTIETGTDRFSETLENIGDWFNDLFGD